MNTITRDELKTALEGDAPVTLLEALPEKYYRHSHLHGARLIPTIRRVSLHRSCSRKRRRASSCTAPAPPASTRIEPRKR